MVGGRRDRGLYGGRNVQGARVWLEVDVMYQAPGCGWR